MPQIDVSKTTCIADAVRQKLHNTRVTPKTLGKLDDLARRLYGIGNMRSPLRTASTENLRECEELSGDGRTDAGGRDIANALELVGNMPDNQARRDLTFKLGKLQEAIQQAMPDT